jgi:hypothetical protein
MSGVSFGARLSKSGSAEAAAVSATVDPYRRGSVALRDIAAAVMPAGVTAAVAMSTSG